MADLGNADVPETSNLGDAVRQMKTDERERPSGLVASGCLNRRRPVYHGRFGEGPQPGAECAAVGLRATAGLW